MIADCYERMSRAGQITSKTARENSRLAYQKVIDNYAGSPAALIAQSKLAIMEQE